MGNYDDFWAETAPQASPPTAPPAPFPPGANPPQSYAPQSYPPPAPYPTYPPSTYPPAPYPPAPYAAPPHTGTPWPAPARSRANLPVLILVAGLVLAAGGGALAAAGALRDGPGKTAVAQRSSEPEVAVRSPRAGVLPEAVGGLPRDRDAEAEELTTLIADVYPLEDAAAAVYGGGLYTLVTSPVAVGGPEWAYGVVEAFELELDHELSDGLPLVKGGIEVHCGVMNQKGEPALMAVCAWSDVEAGVGILYVDRQLNVRRVAELAVATRADILS